MLETIIMIIGYIFMVLFIIIYSVTISVEITNKDFKQRDKLIDDMSETLKQLVEESYNNKIKNIL